MKYLMPLILIVVAVVTFVFYTNPQYQTVKKNAAEYQAVVEANTNAAQLRAVREKLTGDRAKISEADVDKLVKMLPDGVENIGLIIDIDTIAKSKYGLRIRSTKINDVSSKVSGSIGPNSNKYGAISLSFSVLAPYETFISFLKDLESSQRLVDVTNLSFSSASKADIYDFNVTLQTYWLK